MPLPSENVTNEQLPMQLRSVHQSVDKRTKSTRFSLSLLTVLSSAAWVKLNRAGPTYLTLPTALFYPVHPILTRTMVPSNGGCCGHTHRYRGLHNQKFHTTTIGTFSFQKHNTNSSDAASRASKIGGLNKKSWPMYAHPFLSYT